VRAKPHGSEGTVDPKIKQQTEEFLNPVVLRPRLVKASVFIACFEAMKDSIVDRVKEFFGKDPRYLTDVKDRRKKYPHQRKDRKGLPFNTLEWLKEMGVVEDNDIDAFARARACRNILAHELFTMLDSGLPANVDTAFDEMVAVLRKIDVWWIRDMEWPEELEGKEVPDSEIISGLVAGMHMVRDIALGDSEKSKSYIEAFRKLTGRAT
jgi:hypothetical protein